MWVIGLTEDMIGIGTAVIIMTEEDMTVIGTTDITMTGGEEDTTVTETADITMTGIEDTTKKDIANGPSGCNPYAGVWD
jgi:glycerol-3-phosphate dehydrogenase